MALIICIIWTTALVAAALTGWVNFWLIRKSSDLPRQRALSKAFGIATVQLVLLIICLQIWIFVWARINDLVFEIEFYIELSPLTQFSSACLTFFIFSPLVTTLLFADKKKDVGSAIEGRKDMKRALGLAIESAAFCVAFFFMIVGLALGSLDILFRD